MYEPCVMIDLHVDLTAFVATPYVTAMAVVVVSLYHFGTARPGAQGRWQESTVQV